jgi:hypothetical protein
MIQAILLIALGFLSASLIGVIVAPSLWSRAYRLSRKRLERTLPVTLSEVEASQDRLRASYAVQIRRLESALASAKQKAAMQLVDNSRLQMQILELKDQIAGLDLKLAERQNAATVLEQTITKRFPELDREITAAKGELQERSYEIEDLTNKLSRRGEELEAARRTAAADQEELTRLREAFEKNAADRSGRRTRRASQWSLEDYRAEYDRLNLELSRLRQQLAQLQDRDAQQGNVIKEELQKLAELILASAQPKPSPRAVEKTEPAAKRAGADTRRDRPLPWPESVSSTLKSALEDTGKRSQEPEKQGGADAAPGTVLAAVFDAVRDVARGHAVSTLKPEAGEGAEGGQTHHRSMLLREAVPAKGVQPAAPEVAVPVTAGESPESKAAAASLAANGADAKKALAAKDASAAGETKGGLEAAPTQMQPDAQPAERPEPAETSPAVSGEREGQGRTLVERLRGAAGETAEPGN